MARLNRSDRISVTLSPAMRIALAHLANRHGTGASQEASILLRQALSRTIDTPEVQRQVKAHNAARTAGQWRDETQTEHAIEQTHAQRDWEEAATTE